METGVPAGWLRPWESSVSNVLSPATEQNEPFTRHCRAKRRTLRTPDSENGGH